MLLSSLHEMISMKRKNSHYLTHVISTADENLSLKEKLLRVLAAVLYLICYQTMIDDGGGKISLRVAYF